jgi:H+/Cl- antiporter ClcA
VSLNNHYSESSITTLVSIIGLFCAIVAILLFVSISLMRELFEKIGRVHSAVQIEAAFVGFLAILLVLFFESQLNFDGADASDLINREMPD